MKNIELNVSAGAEIAKMPIAIAENVTILELISEIKGRGIELLEVEEEIFVQINGKHQVFKKTMTLLACGIRHGHHVHFHKHHHRHHHEPPCNKLIVVVSGKPTTVVADPREPLSSIIPIALDQTDNTGQPPENWELKDAKGKELDLKEKIEKFHFPCGTTLFLSLRAGIGG